MGFDWKQFSYNPGGAAVDDLKDRFGSGGGQADNSAARSFEALTRAQWDTYLSTFVPLENEMIAYATSPDTVTNAVAEARSDVAASFDQQQGQQQRQLRGLGLTLTPEEQQASERATGLARSLADVNAINQVTRRVKDRQQSILGNPAPTAGGTMGGAV